MELPLTALKDDESGIIKFIKGSSGRGRGGAGGRGRGFQRRLMDMGLTPGTRVTVVRSAPFRGPVEVSVRGSRLALGRGMAERIFVETNK
ncbi:MAG: ferrous iron transport protein A [Candidatus Bathyarchaeota archaeon]|nr:ferrous iron transport protein A [Candidatus Bathyarchaeota archaeon]